MTSTITPSDSTTRGRLDAATAALFVGAAIAFNAGGALHPNDDGHGDQVEQLHSMLLQSTWYPSHLLLLLSFGLFTVALHRVRRTVGVSSQTSAMLRWIVPLSALTTVLMVPHALAAMGASSLADGRSNALSAFMTVDETLADAPWALAIAVLALVAGAAHDLGNRITAVLGVVGGASFALAAVTIPFADTFDTLFAVGGAGITLWALAVAAVGVRRHRQG